MLCPMIQVDGGGRPQWLICCQLSRGWTIDTLSGSIEMSGLQLPTPDLKEDLVGKKPGLSSDSI